MKKRVIVFALLLIAVEAIALSKYWDTVVDDAYITWRYSKHLAEGYGLRWNIDDPAPTQGYTSTLWTLLNAGAIKLGLDPLVFSKTLLLISLLTIALLVSSILSKNPFACIAAITAIVFFPATPTHLWSGMETMFFAATVFAIAWAALQATDTGKKRYIYAIGILGALSYLTRPEGAIAAGVALLAVYLERRDLKTTVIAFIPIVLAVTAHLLFGTLYFGDPLPLPVYRKGFVENSFKTTLLATIVEGGTILVYLGIAILGSRNAKSLKRALILFTIAAATFAPYAFIGRTMDFAARFAYAPMLLSITAMFIALEEKAKTPKAAIALALLAFIIGMLSIQGAITMPGYGERMRHYAEPIAAAMLETVGKEGRVATGDIGAIGYLTDAHICDLLGLTNVELAKGGDDRNVVMKYLEKCDPDVIIIASRCKDCIEPYYNPQKIALQFARENNYTRCEKPFAFSDIYYHIIFVKNPAWCTIMNTYAEETKANIQN